MFKNKYKNEINVDERVDANGYRSESDEDVRNEEANGVGLLGAAKAPKDATGCTKIKSLKEYISNQKKGLVKNPRNDFFDQSREYYNSKYAENKERTIIVKSYLITEDYENFVKDLSMEIIQTN